MLALYIEWLESQRETQLPVLHACRVSTTWTHSHKLSWVCRRFSCQKKGPNDTADNIMPALPPNHVGEGTNIVEWICCRRHVGIMYWCRNQFQLDEKPSLHYFWKQFSFSDIRLASYQFPHRWSIEYGFKGTDSHQVCLAFKSRWSRFWKVRSIFSHFVRKDTSHLFETISGFFGRYDYIIRW